MYILYVSWNCGISYHPHIQNEDKEVVLKEAEKMDENLLRWYIEKDGEDTDDLCGIHKGIFSTLEALRSMEAER